MVNTPPAPRGGGAAATACAVWTILAATCAWRACTRTGRARARAWCGSGRTGRARIIYRVLFLRADRYPYTEDLLALQRGVAVPPRPVPPQLAVQTAPLDWRAWEAALAAHPDRRFADYISQGVREGFRIGFNYTSRRESASRNMRSTVEHPEAVYRYLEDECSKGRVLGPFPPSSVPQVHVSRLGVVPKKGIDKCRLILDLSSPEGRSVNDGIRPELCSLSYVSVDDAARMATRAGQGALLAKVDIKSAYRLVPVHPEDRLLLGMAWDGAVFVDTVLPFGLRSAPKIFTALADALEWMIRRQGVQTVLHYLDDFLIVGQPNADQCAVDLQRLLEVFASLRVPVVMEKLEGPTTRLVFLGIELDTKSMCMRLPPEKLEELRVLLGEWQSRKFCRISELRSLVGKLQHACKVVRPGRTFLRRMFDLLKGAAPRRQPFVRLNAAFRSDLAWWRVFLATWNGVSLLADRGPSPPDVDLYTDAAGAHGCGAWAGTEWFQYTWPPEFQAHSIAVKELLPIVMACVVWGKNWARRSVLAHCDNQSVVQVVNSGYSKDPHLMQLLRSLFFVITRQEISLRAVHIPGKLNTGADAISRDDHFQVPSARPSPTPLPPALLDLLVHSQPDWTSPSWLQLFEACFQQA